jgi:hypothetical protein
MVPSVTAVCAHAGKVENKTNPKRTKYFLAITKPRFKMQDFRRKYITERLPQGPNSLKKMWLAIGTYAQHELLSRTGTLPQF